MSFYECPGDGNAFILDESRKKMKLNHEKIQGSSLGKSEGTVIRDEALYQPRKYKSNVVPFKLKKYK